MMWDKLLEVGELAPGRTTGVIGLAREVRNQHGVAVLAGRQRSLLRRRPA